MANAAYSIAPRNDGANAGHEADATSMCNVDDRLDAARAILGISPSSVADSTVDMVHSFGGRFNKPLSSSYARSEPTSCLNEQVTGGTASACATLSSTRRPRSNSAGLDALAFLATREQEANEALSSGIATTEINRRVVIAPILSHGDNMNIAPKVISSKPHVASAVSSSSCSSDDDSETMPPPPPRIATMNYRRRSVSNPEGMEKWAPMDSMRRFHLVLPASILEEELAEATAAMRAKEETIGIPECNEDPLTSSCESDVPTSETDREKEDTDHDLPHDELLRRARSRLLEDLSEGNLNGEKGVLTLPHSLSKYKEVRVLVPFSHCNPQRMSVRLAPNLFLCLAFVFRLFHHQLRRGWLR